MNEVALEVSAVNEVAPEVSAVNKVNEVAPEESTVIKDSDEVCDVKEDMSKGKSLEIEAKVQVEEFGMKEVMQIDDLKMKKESRHASWDPGEPVSDKAQTEMLDAKEEKILVNNGKVGLRGDVNWMVFYAAMELNIIVISNFKEMLVAFSLSRFVNGFRLDCRIELSDYG